MVFPFGTLKVQVLSKAPPLLNGHVATIAPSKVIVRVLVPFLNPLALTVTSVPAGPEVGRMLNEEPAAAT